MKSIKTLSLLGIMLSFLAGAFISVLDPTQIEWSWMAPVLTLGALSLFSLQKSASRGGQSQPPPERKPANPGFQPR
jgi:hypothetical protein